jgi:hypothetical protein
MFDRPRSLRRIRLDLSEADRARTQEFILRAGCVGRRKNRIEGEKGDKSSFS